MKKLLMLGCLTVFLTTMVYAQDKIEAPVWNVGDKWSFTSGNTVMVMNADENTYTVKFLTPDSESVRIYEKSSLNRLYSIERDRQVKYRGVQKRILNFPLDIGKSWKDSCTAKPIGSTPASPEFQYFETYTVLGWEDIVIKEGKSKGLKIEYKQGRVTERGLPTKEGKAYYWYSPDVKYLIKYQYEKSPYWGGSSDWELTSFELKK